jgi:hypothetical protein
MDEAGSGMGAILSRFKVNGARDVAVADDDGQGGAGGNSGAFAYANFLASGLVGKP